MRKAWKIAALLIGVPAILTGWLALDSYSRAVSAIAAHDSRLNSEIAALRSRQVSSPLLKGRDLSPQALRGLPCPLAAFQDLSAHSLEKGHTVHRWMFWRYYDDDVFQNRWGPAQPARLSADQMVTAMAVTNAAFPEGGFETHSLRCTYEYKALGSLPLSLQTGTFDAAGLRRFSEELDQLLHQRPSLSEILAGEHLLDQLQTLSVLHTRSDSMCWLRRPPGWKEFFSWRILIAKSLNQLEDEYQDLCKLPVGSFPARSDSHRPAENALTLSELEREAYRMVDTARNYLCYWEMARVALALTRFRAEKSREAAGLKDLVPEYLSEVPVNPIDGIPFLYQDGHLKTAPFRNSPGSDWNLRP